MRRHKNFGPIVQARQYKYLQKCDACWENNLFLRLGVFFEKETLLCFDTRKSSYHQIYIFDISKYLTNHYNIGTSYLCIMVQILKITIYLCVCFKDVKYRCSIFFL